MIHSLLVALPSCTCWWLCCERRPEDLRAGLCAHDRSGIIREPVLPDYRKGAVAEHGDGGQKVAQIPARLRLIASVFNMSFKLFYSTVLILVGCLTQLVILVLLSLTVDPYRALAVILFAITVFFCEPSTSQLSRDAC